jgi:thiosulfate dehydrogenase
MKAIARKLDKLQIGEVAWYFSRQLEAVGPSGYLRAGKAAGSFDSRGRFIPPPKGVVPPGPLGQMVPLGQEIFVHTGRYSPKFAGNALSCENCHIDAGRLAYSSPMWAAYVAYRAYRRKSGRVISFAQRLQDCFKFSMNGRAPPRKSKVLLALETYSFFLTRGAPTGRTLKGRGYLTLCSATHGMNYDRGRLVFRSYCAVCHGVN